MNILIPTSISLSKKKEVSEHSKVRIPQLDQVRGLAAILVVIGHSLTLLPAYQSNFFFRFIYSFHMPLFFFISGYLLSVKKFTGFFTFFKTQLVRLFFPYLLWHFLYIQLNSGIIESSQLYKLLQTAILHPSAPWFLHVLFFTSLMFYVLNLILDKSLFKSISTKLYLLTFVVSCLYLAQFLLGPFYVISKFRYFIFYTYLMFFGATIIPHLLTYFSSLYAGISLILISILVITNSQQSIDWPNYFIFTSILGFFMSFFIINWLSQFPILTSPLSYFGKHSLEIYLISGAIPLIIPKLSSYVTFNFLATFGLTLMTINLLNKLRPPTFALKLLFGRVR